MSIEIKRSDKYVDYNISAANNRGYITIDTSDWINKPWMFYELPALKFEIYTETDGELVKYQNFTREIRTYNPVYSPLGVLNVTIDIRNVPEEFILRITPIFDNDAVAARNMLIENGIESGDIWGSDQDVPTQSFDLDIEFIECDGEYIPPVQPTHEETITGIPPITFDGSTGEPLVSWTILGNSFQSGTPTPDNPVMPTFCGVRTENLHNPETDVFGYINPNGDITSSSITKSTDFIPCESGTQYVLRVYKTGTLQSTNQRTVDFYASDKSYIDVGWDSRVKYTLNGDEEYLDIPFIVPTGARFLRFCYDIGYNKSMLNLGSTALPYEPFGWAEKITNAGQTVSVYLGEVPTVRRVRKLVLTGEENWERQSGQTVDYFRIANMPASPSKVICTHYQSPDENIAYATTATGIKMQQSTSYGVILACRPSPMLGLSDFKSYLASEYAAGHPVTIWYVLANEQTEISNEPLCKIGSYSDELHSEDAAVTIPTVNGSNTLTVDTDLQPSLIEISGGITHE